jgi:hypothetical protein
MELLPLTVEELAETLENVHSNCESSKACCHKALLQQIDEGVSCNMQGYFEYLLTLGPAAPTMIFSEGVVCGLALAEVLKLKSMAAK